MANPVFRVKPELLDLLRPYGAGPGQTCDYMTLLRCMSRYLYLRKLYNPEDMKQLYLGGDPIGKVLNVGSCNAANLRSVLPRFLTPIPGLFVAMPPRQIQVPPVPAVAQPAAPPGSGPVAKEGEAVAAPPGAEGTVQPAASAVPEGGGVKRKDADEADDSAPVAKRAATEQVRQPQYYFRLQPESDSGAEGGAQSEKDSVYSVQGYETEYVQNSPDEWTSSEDNAEDPPANLSDFVTDEEDEDQFEIEYEVASIIGSPPHSPHTSDSENEHDDAADGPVKVEPVKDMVVYPSDTDLDFFADCEDDPLSSTDDPEITDTDKWPCSFCKALNRPWVGLCTICFTPRPGWVKKNRLPKHRRKRRKDKPRSRALKLVGRQESCTSGLGSERSKSPTSDNEGNADATNVSIGENDKGVLSPDSGISSHSSSSSCAGASLCSMCNSRWTNACFVHDNGGHMFCYECARKWWPTQKKCPVCRAVIEKVIRLYNG